MNNYLIQKHLMESSKKHPELIAVRDSDKEITYKDLDTKSNQISNLLRKNTVKTREIISVLLSKSIEAIVSFFGILKAGAAYVPLDNAYSPIDRILKIIEISEMQYIITNIQLVQRLFDNATANQTLMLQKIKFILVDNSDDTDLSESTGITEKKFIYYHKNLNKAYQRFDSDIISEDIAYILYTSGSTGIPKGVMISHLNSLTFINWAITAFSPQVGEIFSSHAPFHFDLSVFDIHVALASGGTIALIPPLIAKNPRFLLEWIKKNSINIWYSVPSVWISLLNYTNLKTEDLKSINRILFAGEVFPISPLRRLMQIKPDARYYNLYGPTETNVCTFYEVNHLENWPDKPVPIGKACANTEIIVLKDNKTMAEPGEEGELYVRGSTVFKGYYKDKRKTREAFITSPLKYHNEELLYRTGDIVLRADNENFEFIGRNDFMVKISGYRVELGEIESVLYMNPHVREACVVTFHNKERNTISLGAVVLTDDDVSIISLKKIVSDHLPNYMVPEIILVLPEIPRNSNGKVDRKKTQQIIMNTIEEKTNEKEIMCGS